MDLNSAARSSDYFENLSSRFARAGVATLVVVLAAARFTHLDLLWIEEAYPMAAAAEVLRGKALYRDIWFDKPPLYALVYALWGATPGWLLRMAGALFVCLSSFIAWRCLRKQSGESAGLLAAVLLALYLTFDIPSSVMALAPDLLTVPLHFAAICLAMKRRAFASGLCAGAALLFNGKALFIALACLFWAPRLGFLAGFALPNIVAVLVLSMTGALDNYWQQVWVWGARYSADTFITSPVREGFVRTVNWLGFHATLAIAAVVALWQRFSWRMALWMCVSFIAVCAGLRFFPRYYFQLLPVFIILGTQGLMLLRPKWRAAVLCLALIPVARFGPRYVALAGGDRNWSDLALMNDSRDAAAIVREIARPGDGMLVWGYRPDVFVLAHVPAATPYLDSQPLTGVLADRHLAASKPSTTDLIRGNLNRVANARPAIIVDGLGPLNPELAVTQFPELRINDYEIAGKTKFSTVYLTKR
jgi:hypothetical protein